MRRRLMGEEGLTGGAVPAGETLRISVGPQVRFVRPRRALAPARAPELPSAPAGDTMEGAR